MIFNQEFIFLDVDISTQEEALEFIARKALNLGLVSDQKAIVTGFKKRETEGSTGFEEGIAIPHVQSDAVKQTAIIVVRFKSGVDWSAIDGKPTSVAIALLVPKKNASQDHLSILSDVAVKLMDDHFKKVLKTTKNKETIVKLITGKKTTKPIPKSTDSGKNKHSQLHILAITSCITGVAHTYLAEEKLLKTGKALGFDLRVETHGSKGIGTPFTQTEIDQADCIIFATDTNVDDSRFIGKKVYRTKVVNAIKDPEEVIKKALSEGYVLDKKITNKNNKNNDFEKTSILKHILAGVSYMIPVVILGGICLAFSIGLAKAIWGYDAWSHANGYIDGGVYGPLYVLNTIGGAAFTLMIVVLGGYIAHSIAGRAAIAPAMVASFIGNNANNFWNLGGLFNKSEVPLGFIGAIIAGLAVGYAVKWMLSWKVHPALQAAMPLFFIPLVTGILMSFIFVYIIGAPIAWVMAKVKNAISDVYQKNTVGVMLGVGLGFILGAMGGFDMGGPINKIAFVTCVFLIGQGIYQPMGALAAAIPVAPLGMGFSTVFARRFFNKEEQNLGIAAIIMGCIGISEGAIPFAIRDPRRAIVCNVAGSAVAGAIAGGFIIQDYAGHGGPIVAFLGAIPYGLQTLYFFIAVIIGVVITCGSYVMWMHYEEGAIGSVKAAHNVYLSTIRNKKHQSIKSIKNNIKNIKNSAKEEKENLISPKINEVKQLKKKLINNDNDQKLINQISKLQAKITQIEEKSKTDSFVAIESEREKIKEIKEIFINEVKKAKEVLKAESKAEKVYLQTQKDQIADFKTKFSKEKKIALAKLKTEISETTDKNNKLELKNEKTIIKENFNQKNETFQIGLRKKFVREYQTKLATK